MIKWEIKENNSVEISIREFNVIARDKKKMITMKIVNIVEWFLTLILSI